MSINAICIETVLDSIFSTYIYSHLLETDTQADKMSAFYPGLGQRKINPERSSKPLKTPTTHEIKLREQLAI